MALLRASHAAIFTNKRISIPIIRIVDYSPLVAVATLDAPVALTRSVKVQAKDSGQSKPSRLFRAIPKSLGSLVVQYSCSSVQISIGIGTGS